MDSGDAAGGHTGPGSGPAGVRAPAPITQVGLRNPCPHCESSSVAEILYGLPSLATRKDPGLLAGEFILGGCLVNSWTHHFHACGHECEAEEIDG